MKPCFGYIRVSTPKQGEGVSLEVQKDDITKAAEQRNLQIVEWFEELESAAKTGRPVFIKMAGRLKRGHAEALMVHKLDRSSRNMCDWSDVSVLMDQGIEFHIATELIDFTTRGGRLTADLLAVVAADFSRNHRDEVMKGQRGRLKQGLSPFRAPLGYLKGGKGKPKPQCPQKAPLIRQVFELYASGQHSFKSLQAEMVRRGLRNHSGGQVSLHGIEKILSNPFYHGQIFVERTGETFDGIHEPIITKALFSKVQRVKSGRSGPKVSKHSHLFMGLFRCACCNGPLVPELQKKRIYYRCHKPDCPMTSIREDYLDGKIRTHLRAVQLTKQARALQKEHWEQEGWLDRLRLERRSLLARIEDRQAKQSRLADLLLENAIDQGTYKQKQQDFTFELGQLRMTLDQLPDPTEIKRLQTAYLEKMSSLANLYETAKPEEKRQLLQEMFEQRAADKQTLDMRLASWAANHFTGAAFNPVEDPRDVQYPQDQVQRAASPHIQNAEPASPHV